MRLIIMFLSVDRKCLTFSFPTNEYRLNLLEKKRRLIADLYVKKLHTNKEIEKNFLSKEKAQLIVDSLYEGFLEISMRELNDIAEMLEILVFYHPEKLLEIIKEDIENNNIEKKLKEILVTINDNCIPERLLEMRVR